MTLNYTITTLKRDLIRSFAVLDSWFDKDDDYLDFRPPDGVSVREVFTRALNTGEAIMKIIDAASDHERMASVDGWNHATAINEIDFDLNENNAGRLLEIFVGNGQLSTTKSLPEIRSELRDQLDRCLYHLELLRNSEGVLLSANLEIKDSIDFYQCMQLLSIAIRRHAKQLADIEGQFTDVTS